MSDDENKNLTPDETAEPETAQPQAETEPETAQPQAEAEPETAQPQAETEPETAQPQAEAEPETEDLDVGGRDHFDARYRRAKERDIENLKREMEERSAQDAKAKNRKWWIKTTLLLVLIAASIAIMFTLTKFVGGSSVGFAEMVQDMNWMWFGILIAVLLFAMFAESMKYSYLLKISTGKWRLKNSVKVMFLGKYYDGITPLGTGGQPFQIYYLHKKDIPAGVATAVPLVRYIIATIVFCATAVALFITAHVCVNIADIGGVAIMAVAWVSLVLTLAIPLLVVFASVFPRAGKKFIIKIVGFLNKIHLVKHRYPTMKKYVYEMDEYRHSLRALIRQWWKLIPLLFICMAETATYVLIPYCTVLAVAPIPPADYASVLLQVSCLSMISCFAASLVPTPGSSGANEAMTTLAFLTIADIPGVRPLIGWIVLIWRFFIYYIYILSGIGINIFEIIRSAVRKHRAERASKE